MKYSKYIYFIYLLDLLSTKKKKKSASSKDPSPRNTLSSVLSGFRSLITKFSLVPMISLTENDISQGENQRGGEKHPANDKDCEKKDMENSINYIFNK